MLPSRQLVAQPGHGAIHVVQLQVVGTVDQVILFPALAGAVAARGAEAVQDRQKHGALNRELEMPYRQQIAEDLLASALLPESLENERWPNALRLNHGNLAVAVRGQEQDVLRETGTGGEQAVEVAGVA